MNCTIRKSKLHETSLTEKRMSETSHRTKWMNVLSGQIWRQIPAGVSWRHSKPGRRHRQSCEAFMSVSVASDTDCGCNGGSCDRKSIRIILTFLFLSLDKDWIVSQASAEQIAHACADEMCVNNGHDQL